MGRCRIQSVFRHRDFSIDDECRDDYVMKTGTLVIKSTEYNTLSFVVKEYGADTKNATKRFCPTLVV